MEDNKMEQVANLFGKKLRERFLVNYDNAWISCKFTKYGFETHGAYDNPYVDVDPYILQDLLIGKAVIVDE